MFKRKLAQFSCVVTRRDGATVVPCAMLVATRTRAVAPTIKKYLPANYTLLNVVGKPLAVEIDGTPPSGFPFPLWQVVDYTARGAIVFVGGAK